LQGNALQGTLPAEMGMGSIPKAAELDFSNNMGINGTIPASWAYFSGSTVYLRNTSITGCIPDGIAATVENPSLPGPLPYCSITNTSEATVLANLKALLQAAGASSDNLNTWDTVPQQTGVLCIDSLDVEDDDSSISRAIE
jgi:hypothetical protein